MLWQEHRKINMGYDDDEEYDEGEETGNNRPRSASPPKVVDVEKIKPNTEENKGEIRSASLFFQPRMVFVRTEWKTSCRASSRMRCSWCAKRNIRTQKLWQNGMVFKNQYGMTLPELGKKFWFPQRGNKTV